MTANLREHRHVIGAEGTRGAALAKMGEKP